MHALALAVGLAVTLATSYGWAMDSDQFLKISPPAQSAYVAGVVDTLQARRILEILDKNANASLSDLRKTPFLRCLSETSYGTRALLHSWWCVPSNGCAHRSGSSRKLANTFTSSPACLRP